MSNVILITPVELETLIQQTLRKVLSEHSGSKQEKEQEKFLNIEQAAEFLGLAVQTLYGYTSKGIIPFIKRGKSVRFLKSDLEKWLKEGRKLTIEEMKEKLKREGKI